MTDETPDELQELLAEVRRIEVQSRRLVNEVMAGGYQSSFRGAGIEFSEVREFVTGDDPRAIDWNVTARAGRPFIKKYVDERELTLLFVLDLSPSMSAGTGVWSLRQMAARVIGCLAFSAVRSDDKTGLLAGGQGAGSFVPPQKGLGHALRIVRDALVLPPRAGLGDLGPALTFASRALRRRTVMFVVSDFLGDGWQEPLRRCARRHDLVAVHLQPPELQPPTRGLLLLRDPESGRERLVDFGDARVRAAYERRVASWRQSVHDALLRAGADRMDVPLPHVPDPDAVARPILSFFQRRQRQAARR